MRAYAKNLDARRVSIQGMLWPYGISISEKQRKAWESLKLVPAMPGPSGPEPAAIRWSEWVYANSILTPEIVLAEYATAAYLLERCSWSEAEVRSARFHLASAVEANDDPIRKLDGFFSVQNGIRGREDQYIEAFAWLMTVLKFSLGLPVQGGVEAVAISEEDGRFAYSGKPSDEDSICYPDGNGRHPREIKLTEAEIVT